MFITAVCVLFLIKLRWPRNKSLYEIHAVIVKASMVRLSYKETWEKLEYTAPP